MPTEIKNFWNTTTVPPNGAWVSNLPDFKEIIILGAGGAGLSVATALSFRGAKDIAVIDAMLPGWRGARKGIGAAIQLPLTPHLLYANGYDIATSFKVLRMANIGIKNVNSYIQQFWPDKDWCRKLNFGGFHLAFNKEDEAKLDDCNKFYKCGQIQSSLMKSDAIASLTSLRLAHNGIFLPNEMTVNPAKYFNGIITGIRKAGVEVWSGFSCSEIFQDGINWVVGDGLGNIIKCRKLIICTGANLSALPSIDSIEEFVTRKRITYAATPEIGSLRLPPYVISSLDGSEVYRRYDNRIIVALDSNDTSCADMKEPHQSAIKIALHRISMLYPLTDNEKTFDYVWTRNVLTTKDSLPLVGEIPQLRNLYLNIGYSQHSLGLQMAGATILAELILGSTKTKGVEVFSLDRILG